ncbi:MTH1187 family thiamine-binding protein [Peptoniphilus equinus]|uniref:MTH1187 family thiamine-binding protein n=1 Tax=Peptoniphilus equinus TaxID=3016343 RepID=A0ABY7QU43_9FIRM|nr:MTH1187 family thiamine-binding protein [Peptoniphilus equinus]WBW49800.1 MTH1187 family thiamine-binding protein [Peptoniphilus equinus]
MAVLEVTLVPIGTQTTSCSSFVAKAFDVVKDREDIKVQLNPMGTVLEGDIDVLFDAVRCMQEAVFKEGAGRVYSIIKVDDRRDKVASLEQKIQSVQAKL